MKDFSIYLFILIVCLFLFGENFHVFIHQSFQQYFAFGFFAVFCLGLMSYFILKSNIEFGITTEFIISIIWGIYILIHSIKVIKGEFYTVNYLLFSILYFVSLQSLFSFNRFKFNWIYLSFAVFSVIQSIICVLQFAGILHSSTNLYKVCGTFYNPNSLAMLLAVTTPFFISEILKRKGILINSLFLILLFFAIYTLKCRTAYIGLVVITLLYGYKYFVNSKSFVKTNIFRKLSIGGLLFIVLFSLLVGLYHYKRNSADGRLFIWKVSIEMLSYKPLVGYGYGLFQKEYNVFQANYFNEFKTTSTEKLNADFVYMPYNDVVEQAIQGGVIGMLLYVLFVSFLVIKAIRNEDIQIRVIIISTVIMSSVNFVLQSIPLWLLFLTTSAFATSSSTQLKPKKLTSNISKVIGVVGGIATVVLTLTLYRNMNAQRTLMKSMSHQNGKSIHDEINKLKDVADDAGTSEIFFTSYGTLLLRENNLMDACGAFEYAAQYSSMPQLLYNLAYCYEMQGEIKKSEQCLRLIANMIPSNFESRYRLMILYQNHSKKLMSKRLANEILRLPIKKAGDKVNWYRDEAKKIMNEYELNTLNDNL